jgi:hypothetical protein
LDKHIFKQGKVYATCCHKDDDGNYCNKKAKHLIHKMPKPKMFQPGEVVGGYVVQTNGEFRRIYNENC